MEPLSSTYKKIKLSVPYLSPGRTAGAPKIFGINCTVLDNDSSTSSSSSLSLLFSRSIKFTYTDTNSDIYFSQIFDIGLSPLPQTTSPLEQEQEGEQDDKISPQAEMLNRLKIQRKPSSSVTTNDHSFFIAKGGYSFDNCHYLYSIYNSADTTTITLFQLKSNQKMEFKLTREYFDYQVSIRSVIKSILNFMKNHSRYSKLIASSSETQDDEGFLELPFEVRPKSSIDITPITTISLKQKTFREILGRDENPRLVYKFHFFLFIFHFLFIQIFKF